jgi:hypothetical protein
MYCSKPATITQPGIPNANLSVQDKADIVALASHFSMRAIDTINVWRYQYVELALVPPDRNADFYGVVTYDSTYSDTDRISYQTLVFYNRRWSAFVTDSAYDSGRVFINDWYSAPQYLSRYEKRVFTVDTATVMSQVSDTVDKVMVTTILRLVLHNQYSAADTNLRFAEPISNIEKIEVSIKNDTTSIVLVIGKARCVFKYVSGLLSLSGIWVLKY